MKLKELINFEIASVDFSPFSLQVVFKLKIFQLKLNFTLQ
jgi:hypothetical protein